LSANNNKEIFMSTLSDLQAKNPQIKIHSVTDPEFKAYGRVFTDAKADAAIAHARKVWKVDDSIAANVSVPEFEADKDLDATISQRVYGQIPVQVGWVYGRNSMLNALEYHQGSEVHMPLEDVVFLLYKFEEIDWTPDPMIDTTKVKAFFCPKGTVAELAGWALHYVPVHVHQHLGFCDVFTLPKESGTALTSPKPNTADGKLLVGKNQWVIAHPDFKDSGCVVGMKGPNIKINPLD
jgi:hypothetical protein